MNLQDIKKDICRVCLSDSVVLDWNSPVYGYCDITYKDCFYKYTQLHYPVSDPFSPMLCQICINGLYNVHTFILKALESHNVFKETYLELTTSINFKDVKYTPPEFESVLMDNVEVESILQNNFAYEHSDGGKTNKPAEIEDGQEQSVGSIKIENEKKIKSYHEDGKIIKSTRKKRGNKDSNSFDCNMKESSNNSLKKTWKKLKFIAVEYDGLNTESKEKLDDGIERKTRGSDEKLHPKEKKKYKEIKKPRMCSICSKILHNKYAVELHEKTHMDNRERKETCKICGLKFYDKRNLYSHKRIHKENREKIHKCEFCDKAFYDKGGLNIHRRIHLGQMISCTLCSKQFYRQIDLDRHMGSHSATTINSDTKKRSRYFVRCKHCNKSILSTSFKSHTAAHLNEPLMKCSICSKEFFRRASCVLHIKKIHQKTNEEYNNFITLYTKNRISHLFLEQKAEIQFVDE